MPGGRACRHRSVRFLHRPSTRERDESLLRRYALPRFGDAPLAAISQHDVRAWVADLSARGLAPATVQKAYQLLGKVLGAAVDAGMLAQSPCRRVPLPKVEREVQDHDLVGTHRDAAHPDVRRQRPDIALALGFAQIAHGRLAHTP